MNLNYASYKFNDPQLDPDRDHEDRELLDAVYDQFGASKDLTDWDIRSLAGEINLGLIKTLRNPYLREEVILLKKELQNYLLTYTDTDGESQDPKKSASLENLRILISEVFYK